MSAEMWGWTLAVFLLGVLAGGFVWVPLTIKRQQEEFQKRMDLALRYREGIKDAQQRLAKPRTGGDGA